MLFKNCTKKKGYYLTEDIDCKEETHNKPQMEIIQY